MGAVVFVVGISGLVLSACSSKSPTAAKSTSTTAATAATSTPTTSSTTAPSQASSTTVPTSSTTIPFAVSQVQTGTGPASLAKFSVPSKSAEWDIDWVYDCTKSPGGKGTFAIKVVGYGKTAKTSDADVSQSGTVFSGISKNYDTGTFSLNVTTACKWTVRVEVIS